ncbi:MAG: hypothetical protein KGJ36_06325 [Acidobacteriota bacterium]|nr:hypothetical protein [Acidobacteriota bacterium]
MTASSARSPAPAPRVSVASGALAGRLTPAFAVAVIPLRGPGTWTLSGSTTLRATLNCPSVSGPVVGTVQVTGSQDCQLTVSSSDASTSSTWLLTPVA